MPCKCKHLPNKEIRNISLSSVLPETNSTRKYTIPWQRACSTTRQKSRNLQRITKSFAQSGTNGHLTKRQSYRAATQGAPFQLSESILSSRAATFSVSILDPASFCSCHMRWNGSWELRQGNRQREQRHLQFKEHLLNLLLRQFLQGTAVTNHYQPPTPGHFLLLGLSQQRKAS